jgi:phosphoesterase RecJ-like protein
MLDKKLRVYNQLLEKIKLSKNIALISHKNPDIDTIGSVTAFFETIKNNFLYKNIDLICVDIIPEKYRFLTHTNRFKQDFNPKNYDLIIFFDSGSKTQT